MVKADFISVHAPAVDGGALINAERIAKMKDGVVIINTSRGTNVDEAACSPVWRAARSAPPVWTCTPTSPPPTRRSVSPDGSCTPHIGAATVEAQKRIGAEIVDIISKM